MCWSHQPHPQGVQSRWCCLLWDARLQHADPEGGGARAAHGVKVLLEWQVEYLHEKMIWHSVHRAHGS